MKGYFFAAFLAFFLPFFFAFFAMIKLLALKLRAVLLAHCEAERCACLKIDYRNLWSMCLSM